MNFHPHPPMLRHAYDRITATRRSRHKRPTIHTSHTDQTAKLEMSLQDRDIFAPLFIAAGTVRLGHVDGDGEELELSYALRTCAWGFGYATEAVRALLRAAATELPDQPVLIVTQSAYSASLRVGERLGFAIVTTFEEFEAEQTLEAANLHTFRTGEVSRF